MKFCKKCDISVNNDSQQYCRICGGSLSNEPSVRDNNPVENYSMAWFFFLTYFWLFFFAVSNIIMGISTAFGIAAKNTYYYYGTPYASEVLYGICLIALGIYSIPVRFKLAKFKKDSPDSLLLLFFLKAIVDVIYIIATTAGSSVGVAIIFLIAINGLFLWANNVYFRKRESLFIN